MTQLIKPQEDDEKVGMIELSDQLRYAIYLPAIQANYARFAMKDVGDVRKMPAGLEPSDFNFLKPGGRLFHFPAALYSAGQFSHRELKEPRPCMVTSRDHSKTLVIGDSGGYKSFMEISRSIATKIANRYSIGWLSTPITP